MQNLDMINDLKNELDWKMSSFFRYDYLYRDHLEIAREKFVEKFKRDPSEIELINFMNELMECFYSDC